MGNIIEVRNLHYTYPDGTQALRGIDLDVEKGERLVIMGENGSGKSTFFLHLNGVLKPTQGRVCVKGKPIDYSRRGLLDVRKEVGIVFQNPDNQLFSASVLQEISFGVLNLGFSEEAARQKVEAVMESLHIDDFQDRPTHFLSGGQKKRVAIADVVVMEPDIMLFDEPTAELDPYHASRIDEIIDQLYQQGITVILSTHNVDRAMSWADRIVLFHQGEIVGEGAPENIFTNNTLLEKTHLETPKVLQLFRCLQTTGVLSPNLPIPHTVQALEQYIEKERKQ